MVSQKTIFFTVQENLQGNSRLSNYMREDIKYYVKKAVRDLLHENIDFHSGT